MQFAVCNSHQITSSCNPKSAEVVTPRSLQNIGECLWRDSHSGIIYAIVKRTDVGKKIQHKKSLGTTDIVEARQRLAEFRLELVGIRPVIIELSGHSFPRHTMQGTRGFSSEMSFLTERGFPSM